MVNREQYLSELRSGGISKDIDPAEVSAETIQHFLEAKPENPIGWFLLGAVLQLENRFDASIEAYNKALEICPDYFHALHNLSVIYRTLGDYDSAQLLLRQCISIDPESAEAWYSLGILYILKEEFELTDKVSEKLERLRSPLQEKLAAILSRRKEEDE